MPLEMMTTTITAPIQSGKTTLAVALVNGFTESNLISPGDIAIDSKAILIAPTVERARRVRHTFKVHNDVEVLSWNVLAKSKVKYQCQLIVIDDAESLPLDYEEILMSWFKGRGYKPSVVFIKCDV